MKKLTLDQWQNKYIVGPIERFDQKHIMQNRPTWDPEIQTLMKNQSSNRENRNEPGFQQQDQALRMASRHGTKMVLLNTHRPNTPEAIKKIAATIEEVNPAITAMRFRPPTEKVDVSNPERMTRDVKKVARYLGADLVGVCRLDERFVYSHTYEGPASGGSFDSLGKWLPLEIPEEFQYAVVMCYEEDYDLLEYSDSPIPGTTSSMGYSRMAVTNNYLSAFIRYLGFKTIDCTTNDIALSIPMAMQAGLGDLGRNGLLITPQFGPRVRISKVITDLPLIPDTPIDFGVTEFCTTCKKCAVRCPSRSIMFGERTTEPNNISNNGGVLKWPYNAVTCNIAGSQLHPGCMNCVSVCPYNKPNTWPHRTVRWFTDHVRWADSLYVKMDDLFGYGKPRKPDNFWEEWQPRRL